MGWVLTADSRGMITTSIEPDWPVWRCEVEAPPGSSLLSHYPQGARVANPEFEMVYHRGCLRYPIERDKTMELHVPNVPAPFLFRFDGTNAPKIDILQASDPAPSIWQRLIDE